MPRVDIQRILQLKAELAAFNSLDLSEVDLMSDGLLVPVTQATIDRFEMTGLSNVDFITSGYYKGRLINLAELERESDE